MAIYGTLIGVVIMYQNYKTALIGVYGGHCHLLTRDGLHA